MMHRISEPIAPSAPSTSIASNPQIPQAAHGIPKAPAGVDIDANITNSVKRRGDGIWFYHQVKPGGPWDYKEQGTENEFEDFGNFHYGATGAAMGFSEETLLRMAGRQQVIDRTARPEYGGAAPNPIAAIYGIGGRAPFQDDPKDQSWISRGYEYYHQQKERWEARPAPPSKLRGSRKPKNEPKN